VNPIGKAVPVIPSVVSEANVVEGPAPTIAGRRILFAAVAVLALAACSGNFGSGGSGGIAPPVGPQAPAPGATPAAGASPLASPTGDTATYPFAQAPAGLQCPSTASRA
jgi:hypothetical protein